MAPLQVENETKAQLPSKQGTSPEQTSAVEESIFKISGHLSTISRNQKYFRTRENRNFATVESTEQRIVRFSMIQILLIVAMGGLQVAVVRFFFQVRLCVALPCSGLHTNYEWLRARARATSKWTSVCFRGSSIIFSFTRRRVNKICRMQGHADLLFFLADGGGFV